MVRLYIVKKDYVYTTFVATLWYGLCNVLFSLLVVDIIPLKNQMMSITKLWHHSCRIWHHEHGSRCSNLIVREAENNAMVLYKGPALGNQTSLPCRTTTCTILNHTRSFFSPLCCISTKVIMLWAQKSAIVLFEIEVFRSCLVFENISEAHQSHSTTKEISSWL